MADRSTYRQQYQNQVAELGDDTPGLDEDEVSRARQLLQDFEDDKVDDGPTIDKARLIIETHDRHQAMIRKVRLHCCEQAFDKADAVALMEYLGIAPHQANLPSRVLFSPTTLPDSPTLIGKRS